MSRATVARMMRYQWRRMSPWDLVRYIVPDAHRWLDGNPFADSNDYHRSVHRRKVLVQRIYEHVVGLRIEYVSQPYPSPKGFQDVRTIHEVLRPRGTGTCLDLTLAFCGLCEACDLIPCMLLLDGHALA